MPVPSSIADLSTTVGSNSPAGTEAPSTLDNYQRAHASFIAQLRAVIGGATDANIPTSWTTDSDLTGAVTSQSGNSGTTAGTSTAYTLTPSTPLAAYTANSTFWVKFHTACGASPTLQISGLSTPPNLVRQNSSGTYVNVSAGEIPTGHYSRVTLISPTQALVEDMIAVDLLNSTRIDVASASTVNLTTSAPNTRHINITGTTTIYWFLAEVGQCYFVRFNDALTLANGVGLVTQTGADIKTAAGDTCILRATSLNWVEVLSYTPATSKAIGDGQSWSDVSGSRAVSTTYTNTTGRTIAVAAEIQSTGGPTTNRITLKVSGVTVSTGTYYSGNANQGGAVFGIVPNLATYEITKSNGNVTTWAELR